MNNLLLIVGLIIGFILLIKGADIFVESSKNISFVIGIPPLIVGLIIVSIGTSLPELGISLTSALNGKNGMAVGNVLGSNVFNILMVLGATALMAPIMIKKSDIKRDYMVTLLASVILLIISCTTLFTGTKFNLSRVDGLILLIGLVVYLICLIKSTQKNKQNQSDIEGEDELAVDGKEIKMLPNILKACFGTSLIAAGAYLVVETASKIGLNFGMSEQLIGLTIASIGSSLPELVTSVVAAIKGENEIALGNALGSCIFNILLILGMSSLITPIAISATLMFDFVFSVAIVLLLGIFVFLNKKEDVKLGKFHGLIFVLLYIAYFVYIIVRN